MMGFFNSKMYTVQPIQNNVRKLNGILCEINQHRDLVNITLKEAILRGLGVYLEQIKKYRSDQISYMQRGEIIRLINDATKMLERLPTYEKKFQKTADVRDEPQAIKNYLHEIEKGMKFHNIPPHDYRDILNNVLIYFQQYDAISQSLKLNSYKLKDNKNAICVLVLELFVRLPLEDIFDQVAKNPVEILKEVVKNIDASQELLQTLDLTKVTISNAEHMKNLLENVKTISSCLCEEVKVQIEKIEEMDLEEPKVDYTKDNEKTEDEQQIAKYKEHLAHMEKTLHKYESIIKQSSFSAEKHSVSENLREIQEFLKSLQGIPDGNEEILETKKFLSNRAVDLHQILEQMEKKTRKEQEIAKSKERLDCMEKTLCGYEIGIDQCSFPVEEQFINKRMEEIQRFLKELQDVPYLNENIFETKKYLLDRAAEADKNWQLIMDENKNILRYIEKLNKIEQQVREIVESNSILRDKQKFLEKQAEAINSIEASINEEIVRRRTNALNRIEGLIIAESINYLSQFKKTLNYHKMHAQQFAYSKRNSEYEAKKNEILRLSEQLQEVHDGHQCVNASLQTARNNIDEVLKILDKKASHNENVIESLDYLDSIKKHVIWINHHLPASLQTKIQSFNEIRGRINFIRNDSRRVVAKKCEICSTMQMYEEPFYVEHSEALGKLKKMLNIYENDVQRFSYSLDSDCYLQKKDELQSFRKSVEMMSVENRLLIDTKNLMCYTVDAVLTTLEVNGKYNKDVSQCFFNLKLLDDSVSKTLNNSYIIPEKTLETLEQYKEITNSTSSFGNVDVLGLITKLDQKITIGKSKIKLEIVKDRLAQHQAYIKQKTFSPKSSAYKEMVDSIVHFKDSIEDMPEGNPDLDSNKETVLKDISHILMNLDEYVAHILFKKKPAENIIDLQRHFDDFNPKTLNIPKESIEFVTIIQSRAEHLEEKVNHYLGKTDSLDYYILHENLVRLLEELDQLTCQTNEELLTRTVRTMDYIKHLMEQLDNNVAAN